MPNGLPPNLVPYENPSLEKISEFINDPDVQNHMYNKAWDSISEKIYQQPSIPLKSDEERLKPIIDELSTLQESINKANGEIKQLNDKSAIQNGYIKQLQVCLNEEAEKRSELENKITLKDKKLAAISLFSAIIGGVVVVIFEHIILPYLQSIAL